ncbi:MAG: tetratricopeptide repeat protein, partial [Endomicrobia bacterium]|nr:tetratricopeptide repeat protein [Endomicrobiia bacterium]
LIFCLFFILVPILPDVQLYRPKLLCIELLSFLLLSIFILFVVVENKIVYPQNKVVKILVIFLIYIILRYIFSSDKPLAINELKRWCLSIFLMYIVSVIDNKYYHLMITFIIIGSFLSVIYGLLQHTGGVSIIQVPKMDRVMSMFGNPIFFAVHIINFIPMVIGRIAIEKYFFNKLVYFILLVSSLISLYFTKTRAAFIGLFVSCLLFIFLLIQEKKNKIKFISLTVVAFICFIFATKNIWLRQQAHFLIWRDTLRMWWIRSPYIGVGLGRFHVEFVNFASQQLRKIWPEKQFIVNDAHNEYIQFLAENGLVGFLLLVLIILMIYFTTIKYIYTIKDKHKKIVLTSLLCSTTAVLIQNLFSVDLRFIISNVYLFITIGFIIGYISSIQQIQLIFNQKIVKFIGIIVAIFILGLVKYNNKNLNIASVINITPQGVNFKINTDGNALLQQILRPYVASYKLKQEKDFFDEKIVDAVKTLQELEQLKQKFPDKAIIYERIAWIYAKERLFDKAVENYLIAVKLNPNSYAAYNNLGNIMFLTNNRTQAIEFYKKSIEINPTQVDARVNLGILYYYEGKLNLAAEQFNEVLKLQPNNEKAIVYLKKMRE